MSENIEHRNSSGTNAPQRITMKQIYSDLAAVVTCNRGFFYTVFQLLIRPHRAVYCYLQSDRKKFTSPIAFLFFSAALVSFVFIGFNKQSLNQQMQQGFKGYEQGYSVTNQPPQDAQAQADKEQKMTRKANYGMGLFVKYYNIVLVVSVLPLAVLSFLFFKKAGFNFAEHLVINSFAVSVQNLLFLPFAPFDIGNSTPMLAYVCISIGYLIYFYSSVFPGRLLSRVGRSVVSLVLAYLLYLVLVFLMMLAVMSYVFLFVDV